MLGKMLRILVLPTFRYRRPTIAYPKVASGPGPEQSAAPGRYKQKQIKQKRCLLPPNNGRATPKIKIKKDGGVYASLNNAPKNGRENQVFRHGERRYQETT